VVENKEASTITTMDIDYSLDGQTPSTYTWNGSIVTGATANITLPNLSITPGAHIGSISIATVNGAPEDVTTNNNISGNAGQPLPSVSSYTQNFLPVNFTLMNWISENPDNFVGWSRAASTAAPGSGSSKMDFYDSPGGEIDYLYNLNAVDLTNAPSPELRFKVAHKRYSAAYSDKLEVIASSDCGQTWTSVWTKQDPALATSALFATGTYTPSTADWRAEVVNLSQFTGQANVLIGFKATSGYGNNAYIDEVSITQVTGIAEQNNDIFSLYPVPSHGEITLSLDNIKSNDFTLTVSSIDGRIVKELSGTKSGNEFKLDLSDINTGAYFLRITSGNETSVKKIVIEK
ncbi:MAG: T9SS type A sorting domain-containing protein, partial [Bacteroidota bacterium]